MAKADLAIWIRAKDQANKQLKVLEARLKSMRGTFKQLAASTGGNVLLGLGTAGMAGAIMKTGIAFNILEESAEIAFETMLGSSDAALEHLADLKTFAEKTPFEFPDLMQASRRLMSFGWTAEQVIPTLTNIGNAVSAAGGSSELLDRITTAFGQIRAKGKLASQEMMQLTEAGIPAWKMLAEEMGTSIPTAMKAVERGKVPAEKALMLLERGISKRFANLMDRQSNTTAGAISNIKDIARFMMADIMKPIFLKLRDVLKQVAVSLVSIRSRMKSLPGPAKDLISWMGVLSLTLIPILLGLGLLGGIFSGIRTAILVLAPAWAWFSGAIIAIAGFLGAPVLLIAGIIAALVLLAIAWWNNWGDIQGKTAEAVRWIGDRLGDLGGLIGNVAGGIGETLGGAVGAMGSAVGDSLGRAGEAIGAWLGALGRDTGAILNWLGEAFGATFGYVGNVIGDSLGRAGEAIGAWLGGLGGQFGSALGDIGEAVGRGFSSVGDWFRWLYETGVSWAGALWNALRSIWDGIASLARSAWGGIGEIIKGAMNGVIDGINSFFAMLGSWSITVPDWIPGIGGARWGLPQLGPIPRLAEGGIVTSPTLAMIGEAGPEAVIPLGSGGGTRSITVQITGTVYGVDDLEDVIVAAIRTAEQRGRVWASA